MAQAPDDEFFDRADRHINLSTEHLKDASPGMVSASMMYATAKFNGWVSACGCRSGDEMRGARAETVDYFATQFRKMREGSENLDDYIENFQVYIQMREKGHD